MEIANPPTSIQIGQQVGPYLIEGLLGAGGMGVVYLAHDCAHARHVAIKVVVPSRHDPEAVRLLLREARLAAALHHPAICAVLDLARVGDEPLVVMEHVAGSALSALIHRRRALPFETALDYQRQLADAVAYAHEQQVVHGDLKSANIMIQPAGRVKILDFGLAVSRALPAREDASQADTTGVPAPSSCTGTVPYMAPELLRGRAADMQSDIWALGVVFYEMLAGYRPFRGSTVYELAASILANQPLPLPGSVPARAREIIDRCLLTSPGERYPVAKDLAVALSEVS